MSVETSGSLGVAEDPGQRRRVGGLAEGGVHLVAARRPGELDDEIDDRAVRDRRADRERADLPLEFGQDGAERARGAGRGRDQVDRGGARPAQILVRRRRGAPASACRRARSS